MPFHFSQNTGGCSKKASTPSGVFFFGRGEGSEERILINGTEWEADLSAYSMSLVGLKDKSENLN